MPNLLRFDYLIVSIIILTTKFFYHLLEDNEVDFGEIYLQFNSCFDHTIISNNPNELEIQRTVCFLYRHLQNPNFTLDYLFEMIKKSCPVAAENKANQMLDMTKEIFLLRNCEQWKKEHDLSDLEIK